ncbi:MAG TPA: hypothetical protein VHD83_22275 [Puia sp.]|nr:hypothetical protein [Puia sp.]
MLLSIKAIIFIILFFLLHEVSAQDTIYWQPNHKLKWVDFKGKIDATKHYGALSYTGISYSASYEGNSLTFKILTYFNKKESWAKLHSREGLQHEQGHFDITELFARKLRKELKSYVINPSTVNKDLKFIYLKIYNEKNKMQSLYDSETDFSRNTMMQDVWNEKIQKELKNLSEFSSVICHVEQCGLIYPYGSPRVDQPVDRRSVLSVSLLFAYLL